MSEPTIFTKRVIKIISSIPKGQVATYGQIATLAGKPHGARGVVWILNSSAKKHHLPWQRVLAAKGKIAFPSGSQKNYLQTKSLEREGIEVRYGKVDLLKFGWKKKRFPQKRKKVSVVC